MSQCVCTMRTLAHSMLRGAKRLCSSLSHLVYSSMRPNYIYLLQESIEFLTQLLSMIDPCVRTQLKLHCIKNLGSVFCLYVKSICKNQFSRIFGISKFTYSYLSAFSSHGWASVQKLPRIWCLLLVLPNASFRWYPVNPNRALSFVCLPRAVGVGVSDRRQKSKVLGTVNCL